MTIELPTSKDLYRLIQAILAEARLRAGTEVGFYIYAGMGGGDSITFTIDGGRYHSNDKAEGKEFWETIDEYVRRRAFDARQTTIALAAPTIDNQEG
jgi:hypothetical protein